MIDVKCGDCAAPEAPGALDAIRCFANSIDVELETDRLSDPDGLSTWLAEHELMSADMRVRPRDVTFARDVRTVVRDLLEAQTHGEDTAGHTAALDRLAHDAKLTVAFTPQGPLHRSLADGATAAIGDLVGTVASAMEDGTWQRMKLCREQTCQYAFYDQSRNRSGRWCTMSACGNRAKARAYRARRSGDE